MALVVSRFWAHRISALGCAVAVTLVSSGALNAPVSAASSGHSTAKHQIVIKSVVVTQLGFSKLTFTVHATTATKNLKSVDTIAYTPTTVFYGSPASSVKVGTILTVLGVRTGASLTATKIRVHPPSLSIGGPFVGLKYVGNV